MRVWLANRRTPEDLFEYWVMVEGILGPYDKFLSEDPLTPETQLEYARRYEESLVFMGKLPPE